MIKFGLGGTLRAWDLGELEARPGQTGGVNVPYEMINIHLERMIRNDCDYWEYRCLVYN
jgi:hypothetical protein